jgi:hypothetical protein
METKKLVTKRFLQDIATVIVFCCAFYLLTHNPITHPTPKSTDGKWSIRLMQHPLIFGVAGHNFLTLCNGKGEIVKELHGLATDAETKEWKYVGTKDTDILQVFEFDGSKKYIVSKGYAGTILFEGDETTTKDTWNKSASCKDIINNKSIHYPPYGVKVSGDTENSNSVAYTLMLCMGLDTKHLGLITPGWGEDLLIEK